MEQQCSRRYICGCRIRIVNKFARCFDKRSELLIKTAMMINVGLIFAVSVLAAREILGVSHWYIEDGYFDRLNPEYLDVNTTNLEVVWINSTLSGIAVNVTIIKEMPRGLMTHFNMFEKKNGGYKAHSGISVSVPWCKAITDPILVGSVLRAMNLTQCPVPPGTYSVPQIIPTANSLMPDYLPGNQYRLSFVVRTKRVVLLQANVFVSIP